MNESSPGAGPAEIENDALAACALSCVPGVGSATLARFAEAFGSLEQALAAGPRQLLRVDRMLAPDARRFLQQEPDLEALGRWALSAARAAGAKVLLRSHPSYPRLLGAVEHAPALLYVRGSLAGDVHRVALVGARAADGEALHRARTLAEELAAAGVEVVSGGARGVDGAAHAGALWGGGRTIAVLGTGVDVPYPPEHGPLFDRIVSAGGALISEFPPGTPSSRRNFPRRNRTIAGLSQATVVVRASRESGALITANYAIEQQRALFAVAGDPRDELCAGPNHLIEAGVARRVTSAREVLEALDWSVDERTSAGTAVTRPSAMPPVVQSVARPADVALDGPSRVLWAALDERRPLHIDVLVARTRVAPHEALRWLTELELKGLCRQRPGKYFVRQTPWSVNPNGSAGI
ncbi:MAG TPA: DNA-processing protein DprA [Myxococcales bacterium]|nr:DNA-processing protein DprA [Myxococcales bacterium]